MYKGFWLWGAQSIELYVSGRLWEVHLSVFYMLGGGLEGSRFQEPKRS